MNKSYLLFVFALAIFSCQNTSSEQQADTSETTAETETAANTDTLRYEQEKNIANLKQLTFGGDNAEAYFSFDNTQLVDLLTVCNVIGFKVATLCL